MKKIISLMVMVLLLMPCTPAYAFSADQFAKASTDESGSSKTDNAVKQEEPAYINDVLEDKTVDLKSPNGQKLKFVTRGSTDNPNDTVTCELSAKWVTVQDSQTGSSNGITFYVPDSVKASVVKLPGISKYLKDEEGYEWRCMQYSISASKGFYAIATYEDYYTGKAFDDDLEFSDDGLTAYGDFELEVDGKTYEDCFLYSVAEIKLDNVKKIGTMEETVLLRIPAGYDGGIVGITDTRKMKPDSDGYIEFDPDRRGDSDVYYRLR